MEICIAMMLMGIELCLVLMEKLKSMIKKDMR